MNTLCKTVLLPGWLLAWLVAAPLVAHGPIVVDDGAAQFTGKWTRVSRPTSLVGKTYHHDDRRVPGVKSARFTPDLPDAGRYEVRLLYTADANRAANVAVSVLSEAGETKLSVDQRQQPLIKGIPRSLGVFPFRAGKNGGVLVSTQNADGFVVVDAVEFVPLALAETERAAVRHRLAEPLRVRHAARSPAHLRVEWDDAAEDEAGYRIWRRETGGPWYLAGEAAANATHFDDGGMEEQTAYEHQVAAFNGADEGEATATAAATSTLRMEAHLPPEVIIGPSRTYPAGPTAVALKSGELLLAYQTGNAQRRTHAGESIWLMTSRDEVRRWSEPRLLLAGDQQTVYGKAALLRLPEGRIGLSFSRWELDAQGKIVGRSRRFMASADEGETWSDPVDVGPLSANNSTLEAAAGRRILEALSDTTGVGRIFGSDDRGRTWSLLGDVPGKQLGESDLAHLGDGRLVFFARHERPFYRLSYSNDNGATWDDDHSLLYLGGGDNPPKLTLLPDGKTLAAIVHSWYPGRKAKDRRQLASVISRDGGRSWDNFRLIGFAADGEDGFLQHSITFVGDLGYLFYGGGSRLDTNDGDDLRLMRLHRDFFTSTAGWPYDWQGKSRAEAAK